MRIKLHKVTIPAKSSRVFDVPEYDIPILKELWPDTALIPGQRITVIDLGIADWRDPNAEWNRIQAEYSAQVGGVPAYKLLYPAKDSFLVAFRRAGEDGERFERRVAEFVAANPAAPAAERPAPAALEDNLEDDPALADGDAQAAEPAVPAPAKRKAGRPRKPAADLAAEPADAPA